MKPILYAAVLALTAAPALANKVFVSNEKGNTVTVIDSEGWEVLAEFDAGNRPRGITMSPDGALLYVCASDDDTVRVFDTGAEYDASLLVDELGWKDSILIDQGAGDQFLDLLRPEALATVLTRRRQAGQVRMHPGYDHSYFFVSTFAGEHVAWHAERLHG